MQKSNYFMFIGLLWLLVFPSCKEDCSLGTVRFQNTSVDPYNLYINSELLQRIEGSSLEEFSIGEGDNVFRVEQISGFIFVPTVKEETVNVIGCNDSQKWLFP